MRSTFRALSLVAATLAAGFTAALAQDGKDPKDGKDRPDKPAPATPEPATPTPPAKADPDELLRQMTALFAKAAKRPPSNGQLADPKAAAEHQKAEDDWKAAVRQLAKTGDEYLAAIGGAAADARALYYRGFAKWAAGKIAAAGETRDMYSSACDSLQRYLDGTDEKASYRADAEARLGEAMVLLGRIDDSLPHLRRAVDLLQKDGRHDEAGEYAYYGLRELKDLGRSRDVIAFAQAVHAVDGDFGGSTPNIRLFAVARLAAGEPLPPLPKATDLDDKPISFDPGAPLLLHFFYTAIPGTHTARSTDDLDKQIRPLWAAYHAKGLRVVGVCMDEAMTPAQADAMKKKWEDWGTKGDFFDGTPDSCRAWVKKHSVEWTVRCSGLWTNEPLSRALGGVAPSNAHAILVDKDGIVRWTGELTNPEGLAEAAAKLFK